MTAPHHLASERFREIRLMDGSRVSLDLYGTTSIRSDQASHRYDYSWRRPGLEWHDSLSALLVDLLSTHSPIYAAQCALHMGLVAERLNDVAAGAPPVLKLEHFEDYPDHRPVSTWPFVQAVLSRWVDRGLPGLDSEIGIFLRQPEKWEEKGKGQYFALIANDPERGALTEQELRNVYEALNQAYGEGEITTKEWALASFVMGTGVRPIQMARARKGDVIETEGPEGKELILLITLAKTREAQKVTRWRRKCQTQLAEVMRRYLQTQEMRDVVQNEPLFFATSQLVSQNLTSVFKKLRTHSDRLSGPIPLFPYRFRYTMGTRAIALGASDHQVARLLTHTSVHCVQYYRAAMPSLQDPIREALGGEMSLIAQAFQGRPINSRADATRRNDESAIIYDFAHMMGQELGACGTYAKCHQDAPRACLTCKKFEPFRDAPWEDFRILLVDDMEIEQEDRIKLITKHQIDAVDGIIAERDGVLVSFLQ